MRPPLSSAFRVSVAHAGFPAGVEAELNYVLDGREQRVSLLSCRDVPFERAAPARGMASYRGQRNFPGWWYFSKTATHVGFESWLERDHLMAFDADPTVASVSSQPFWLNWWAGERRRRHAPDFFVRLVSGDAVVVDVRPDDRIEPVDAAAFAATDQACAAVGWQYRRVGLLDAVLAANLRWLAGYRHNRCWHADRVKVLREVFAEPRGLMAGVEMVGDPVAILPVVFHMLWARELHADLTVAVLGPGSRVRCGDRR
jgi:hypothetical protein